MSVPGIELEQVVHLDRGGWFLVLLREEIRTHGLWLEPFTELADGKSSVSGKCVVRY
jgi:hypothetical protein